MLRPAALVCGLLGALAGVAAHGHHSKNVTYDTASVVEVTGRITTLVWRNPHVRLTLEQADEALEWEIEGNSVSILQRMGVTPDRIAVGDEITVAGLPSRRGGPQLFATNLLSADNAELLMEAGAESRWSQNVIGSDTAWTGEDAGQPAAGDRPNGVFGVWSTALTNPQSFPLFPERGTNYPLTAAAREHVAAWQTIEDNPYFTCTPMGMPRVMGQPYPIEFVDFGDEIHLRIELHDLVRVIDMTDERAPNEDRDRTPLGYSRGRWDGQSLLVTTTAVSWPYFNQSGIPQSAQSVITERFTPDDDSTRLHYELTVDDPVTFAEPITLKKYWHWRAGEQILPFDCTE
jgi:hypothetical protein